VRVGAPERERRRVRIAERDQVRTPARDECEQVELGRVGVGQLVDVDRGQPAPLPLQQVGLGAQQAGGGAHQLGRVVRHAGPARRVAQREHLRVFAEEPGRGDPVGPVVRRPERSQLLGRYPPLGAAHQQVTELRGVGPGVQRRAQRLGPQLRVGGQQLADHQILLGRGEQPGRRVAQLGRGPPQDAVRVGGEGADHGLGAYVRRDPGFEAVAEPARAAPAERQDQELVGRHPLGHPRGQRLDQHGGLAGAGAAEHEQGTVTVRRHRPLRLVERDRGGGRRRRAQQAVCHADYQTMGVRHACSASTASSTVCATTR
jgi:hypothetical protein